MARALEAKSWTVWWDKKISAGETFDQVIEREIATAQCVVVLWSRHSVASEWVKNEAAAAVEQEKIVPVLIDDVKLPLEFRRRQTVQLLGWHGDSSHQGFQTLCDGVATKLTGKPISTSMPLSKVRSSPLRWDEPVVKLVAALAALIPLLWFGAHQVGLLERPTFTGAASQGVDAFSGVWRHHSGVVWVVKPTGQATYSIEQMDPEKGMTARGDGVLQGDKLSVRFLLLREGVHGAGFFQLSPDRQQLSGRYQTDEGYGNTLTFRR